MMDVTLKFDSSFENRTVNAPVSSDDAVRDQNLTIDWQAITHKMSNGDRNAFTTYYNFSFDAMLKEVRRCSGRDEQTCLDLVQDSMLKAIKSIKPLDSEQKVVAWSRTVAKSVTYDWLRKKSREKTVDLNKLGNLEDKTEFEDQARLLWIESELKALPSGLKKMIELRYRLGWSLAQIGSQFGLKTGAVDGRIRRAVERIRVKACEEFHD